MGPGATDVLSRTVLTTAGSARRSRADGYRLAKDDAPGATDYSGGPISRRHPLRGHASSVCDGKSRCRKGALRGTQATPGERVRLRTGFGNQETLPGAYRIRFQQRKVAV